MKAAQREASGDPSPAGPLEAAVVRVEDGRAVLRAGAKEEVARVAVPGYAPAPGDRVLAQRAAGSGALYVVGVTHGAALRALSTPSGARATLEGERLALHDARGALVAEYDAQTGALRLAAPGDLHLAAPAGRVLVEGRAVALKGGEIALEASAAAVTVGRWELRAERLVERVTDAFRTVDGLLETRAHRLRALVATTLELAGKRTSITSEKDTRIDGERVLLG